MFRRLTETRQRSPIREEATALATALAQSARGDQVAFAEIYDATSDLIYGIALAVLRDPFEAEAVTHDVFVEFWRLAPRYAPNAGSVKSSIAALAYDQATDRVGSGQ